jgi:hypothetical protein
MSNNVHFTLLFEIYLRKHTFFKRAGVAQLVQCLTTDRTRGFNTQQRQKDFSLTSVSGPDLMPTQPRIQWIPVVKSGRGVTLTTHPI